MKIQRRKAVAPVLATLLMIAVAVAMSVIIFMWSQGFLSNTSSATGSQQGAQNVAAQSSIAIESAIANSNSSVTLYLRNVGAVAVTVGSATIQGISSNAGYKSALVITSITGCSDIAKGRSCHITSSVLTSLGAGDVLSFKVTTTAGTFASAQLTVP